MHVAAREGAKLHDDLKDFHARPGFQLFTSEEAGTLLAVLVLGLFLVDLARQAVIWMFG